MSGYDGYSMSNNAVDAYRNGNMPLSKWSKSGLVDGVKEACRELNIDSTYFLTWNKDELMTLLSYSEWHHTGGDFKQTDFYAIDEEKVQKHFEEKTKPEIEKKKAVKSEIEPHAYYHGTYKVTEYHPTSKYNRYNEYWYAFTNGVKKGNWMILADGTKKKFTNCKIEKVSKVRLRNK